MKGENVLPWIVVLKDLEDRFFHFPCKLCAENGHSALTEVEGGNHIGCNSRDIFGYVHFTCIENLDINSLGEVLFKLLFSRSDEHVPHEQSVISSCAKGSNLDSIVFVPSSITINNHTVIAMVDIIDCELFDERGRFGIDGEVVIVPVH